MSFPVRIQLSIMMFIQFFIWGAWFVTMGTYLNEIKFEGDYIGYAYSTMYWAAIISPFFVGMIADRFFNAERVLGVMHLMGGVFLYLASRVTDPGPFIGILLLHALCYMPTLALVNAVSFNVMDDPGKEFPGVRVLGTIGWIVAGLLVSWLKWEPTQLPLVLGAAMSIALGIYCFTLPKTPPKARGEKVTARDVLGLDALALMKDRSFAIFILSSLLICIPLAFYYSFANLFFNELGMEHAAAKMTMGQMSEIFFMLVMPLFFARLGVKYMLLTGMFFWVARYVLFAYGSLESPMIWMFYFGILFHGICYDFFFVTGQIYTDMKAPREIRANAQGFIALVTLGVGMVIGSLISGWIAKYYQIVNDADEVIGHHWRQIWLIPAAMALVIMVLFAILFKDKDGKAELEEVTEAEEARTDAGAGALPE